MGCQERAYSSKTSPISNYCIQKIDKKKNQIRRECSSFMDEHNIEEKCPMSGCHWQSAYETYCCCQFDRCNEWKSELVAFSNTKALPNAEKQALLWQCTKLNDDLLQFGITINPCHPNKIMH
ncbi:unnamed protein product [Heligmosomoides polygyrus]|uniref:Uncharacterized protein n=1 Tax=Heligmosomoides polygyrus TaxID=6339 RepID=A0A3P8BHR3_HELPZ|nr:unnamed protein product [Heligmosomoides polygyrus]